MQVWLAPIRIWSWFAPIRRDVASVSSSWKLKVFNDCPRNTVCGEEAKQSESLLIIFWRSRKIKASRSAKKNLRWCLSWNIQNIPPWSTYFQKPLLHDKETLHKLICRLLCVGIWSLKAKRRIGVFKKRRVPSEKKDTLLGNVVLPKTIIHLKFWQAQRFPQFEQLHTKAKGTEATQLVAFLKEALRIIEKWTGNTALTHRSDHVHS